MFLCATVNSQNAPPAGPLVSFRDVAVVGVGWRCHTSRAYRATSLILSGSGVHTQRSSWRTNSVDIPFAKLCPVQFCVPQMLSRQDQSYLEHKNLRHEIFLVRDNLRWIKIPFVILIRFHFQVDTPRSMHLKHCLPTMFSYTC